MSDSYSFQGIIIKGVGGIYTVRFEVNGSYRYAQCAARGQFRLKGIKPAIGDHVTIMPSGDPDVEYVITDIRDRTSFIARPPVANLSIMLLTFSVSEPEPDLTLLDKMLLVCSLRDLKPVIIFTKSDLSSEAGERLCSVYTKAGYEVLVSSPQNPIT
ncbi:MAG: GTPase RsgA, partial [Clostridiales bacterium]|nr:GTPase RsgA [Clostridiales bacterium]